MDKYDKAIEYFQGLNGEFKAERSRIWGVPHSHPSGCLFEFAHRSLRPTYPGCLSMIRNGSFEAETDELTREIKVDERIPRTEHLITLESLPVFAEWQRRLDRELITVT